MLLSVSIGRFHLSSKVFLTGCWKNVRNSVSAFLVARCRVDVIRLSSPTKYFVVVLISFELQTIMLFYVPVESFGEFIHQLTKVNSAFIFTKRAPKNNDKLLN